MKTVILSIALITTIVVSCHQRVQTNKKVMPDSGASSNSNIEIQKIMDIDGVWNLQAFSDSKIVLKELYPSRIPFLNINQAAKQISGNTSCNSFSGKIIIDGDKIKLEEPMAMTQKFCAGDGEATFLRYLERVKNCRLTDDSSLHLLSGDTLLMKFSISAVSN